VILNISTRVNVYKITNIAAMTKKIGAKKWRITAAVNETTCDF